MKRIRILITKKYLSSRETFELEEGVGMNSDKQGEGRVKGKLYDIHCPSCGAPAYYDIKTRVYNCSYCGNHVGIDRALSERKGFRELQQKKMKESLKDFELQRAVCTGCGAELVFDNGDAVANCAFCGRSLVRSAFVKADSLPELIVPFSIYWPDGAKRTG